MKRAFWSLTAAAMLLCAGMSVAAAQNRPTVFQAGDRILLYVEGDSVLSDTFTVVAGPALRLPILGEIPLAGVSRTDLETHLIRELGRYIKNPVVEARALIRVSVVGEVTNPGFYAVPTDLVVADALMLAGGATQEGRVDRVSIVRGSSALWSGAKLQQAIARGATLDDLGVRAGDRIQVPRGSTDPEAKWRILGIVAGTVLAVIALRR